MVLYICTKFQENISKSFTVIEQNDVICILKFTKGHNSIKSVSGVEVLVLCTSAHRLIMLYICTKFCQSISKGFRVTDPDKRVDARVVANVDGQTENRIPIAPYLRHRNLYLSPTYG